MGFFKTFLSLLLVMKQTHNSQLWSGKYSTKSIFWEIRLTLREAIPYNNDKP